MEKRSCVVGVLCILLAVPALAASKPLTFSDGICEYRVGFDPAKVDRQRLKATLDYLANGASPLELGPPLSEPEQVAGIDVRAYRAACAAHRKVLEAPRFLDDPALDDLRRSEIAELDDYCGMTEAKLRAAKGEPGALRSYAPALPACARWIDAMALPPDRLKAGFGDLLPYLCKTSTEPNICMGQLQRDSEKAPRDLRMRLAILTQGWAECADAQRRARDGTKIEDTESPNDRRKRQLKEALLKRFKAKTLSCAQ